ncbi:MAG TPA: adenylyltransferase/cytidyltransferase family protein [Candidatus Saccharimonadales bacterium]|nr:adenylyltransferase/cytidyltransferase family protein [Candidatus Saccharimonadales bacterium]
MVFGAFDGLHPGHLDFFKQAKKYGDFLIVSVGRDKNVEKIKGKKPLFSEDERFELISNLKIIDKPVMGAAHDYFVQVKQYKPDVICLGYDQWAQEDYVRENLNRIELFNCEVVRLKPYKEDRAKSTHLKTSSVDF